MHFSKSVLSRWPELNAAQIERLSELSGDLGLIAVASFIVPIFQSKLDLALLVSGLTGACGFWVMSLWLLRNK